MSGSSGFGSRVRLLQGSEMRMRVGESQSRVRRHHLTWVRGQHLTPPWELVMSGDTTTHHLTPPGLASPP